MAPAVTELLGVVVVCSLNTTMSTFDQPESTDKPTWNGCLQVEGSVFNGFGGGPALEEPRPLCQLTRCTARAGSLSPGHGDHSLSGRACVSGHSIRARCALRAVSLTLESKQSAAVAAAKQSYKYHKQPPPTTATAAAASAGTNNRNT